MRHPADLVPKPSRCNQLHLDRCGLSESRICASLQNAHSLCLPERPVHGNILEESKHSPSSSACRPKLLLCDRCSLVRFGTKVIALDDYQNGCSINLSHADICRRAGARARASHIARWSCTRGTAFLVVELVNTFTANSPMQTAARGQSPA